MSPPDVSAPSRFGGTRSTRVSPDCSTPYCPDMATLRYTVTTTLTPAQFIAGLTDFGPGRKELFRYSANNYLKVHAQGPTTADVTEGSQGIWERLSYDWSDPHHIVLTTTDSNLWGPGSSHTYDLTTQQDGTTTIQATVERV